MRPRPLNVGPLFMMNRVDPNLWQIPQWHADWDGEFQFASLRAFATAVFDRTDLGVGLAIVEEGYARLEVFCGATRIGVVYVNRAEDRSVATFAVFAGAEDDELNTTDVAAGVRFLGERRTAYAEGDG